jgi:translation initiation factor 5B
LNAESDLDDIPISLAKGGFSGFAALDMTEDGGGAAAEEEEDFGGLMVCWFLVHIYATLISS